MTTESAISTLLVDRIAAAWPNTALAAEPVPLTGGFWASMYRLRLTGQPAAVPADVVFRIAPDPAMGAKELAVQRSIADQGFPTPRIHLDGPADGELGGTWSVMDFAAGSPPLGDLDGLAALRRAPRLFSNLPRMLASAMASLHGIDPEPATAAIEVEAPTVAWEVDDLLDHFGAAAALLDRPDLRASVQALARTRPASAPTVICHGDLHPFNLLVDGGRTTVVDWTGALRAEAAYDVAFTSLLLANPPLDAPRPLGAVIGRIGRLLSRRFIAAYRDTAPDNDLGSLDWYGGLHGTRLLIDGATHEAEHGQGHPFGALAPAAVAAVHAATGIAVAAPA